MSVGDAELIAGAARAVADPTRLQIAFALRDGGELCVCDLAWIVERSDALVSHHLRQLRAAGLVTSRRDGKLVMYSLVERGASLLGVLEPGSVGVR
jgi:DNA-binding transcriptional ArsR family regulator